MEDVIANAMAAGELPGTAVSEVDGVEEWMRLYRGRVFRYILFATSDEDVAERVRSLRAGGMSARDASAKVAAEMGV